jgi:2-oxoglutarate decarboxylase
VRAEPGRPAEELNRVLAGYPQSELMWVQEQPENQSAWPSICFEVASRPDRPLSLASRPAAASPASGSAKHTAEEQVEFIDRALTH